MAWIDYDTPVTMDFIYSKYDPQKSKGDDDTEHGPRATRSTSVPNVIASSDERADKLHFRVIQKGENGEEVGQRIDPSFVGMVIKAPDLRNTEW